MIYWLAKILPKQLKYYVIIVVFENYRDKVNNDALFSEVTVFDILKEWDKNNV